MRVIWGWRGPSSHDSATRERQLTTPRQLSKAPYAARVSYIWLRLRDELATVLVIGGILALFIVVSAYSHAGFAEAEIGEVLRFGSYANDLGNQPTVIVRTNDGRQIELKASPGSLRHCQVGDRVRLVRMRSLRVDPRGCR